MKLLMAANWKMYKNRAEAAAFLRDLTKRQKEILDFILDSFRNEGFIPSVREICDAFGFASWSLTSHGMVVCPEPIDAATAAIPSGDIVT